jgi:Ser/Thr protein kinase RdoA (MazF antagonist)
MISESIRQEVFAELGCSPEAVKLLGGYNSNVFEIERAGAEIVVKILDHTVVPKEHTLSELEWLNYLQECEVNVIRPLCLESAVIRTLGRSDGKAACLCTELQGSPSASALPGEQYSAGCED